MVNIISTKNSEYNDFFAKVIESLDSQFKNTPKIVVFAIPDQENNDCSFSTYGTDSYDLFQAASSIQHEATREIAMEECIKYIDDYMEYYFNDGEEDEHEQTIR